jgi:uncharacterized protein involved in exopolysaccharide biosynthesis
LPIVLAVTASVDYVALQPRMYEASAKMLFYTTPTDVAPTGSPYSYATAAEQQAEVLIELLKTRSFVTAVGRRGPLADYLAAQTQPGGPMSLIRRVLHKVGLSFTPAPPQPDDLVVEQLSRGVQVTPLPPQIVSVSFAAPDGRVAAGTVQAIVDEFSDELVSVRRSQAQAVVTFFEQQLAAQDKEGLAADAAVSRYLDTHPQQRSPGALPDPTLTALRRTADATRQQYNNLQYELDQARLDLAALSQPAATDFRLVDAPTVPPRPASLSKDLLRALVGGLGGGLFLSLAGLLVLTAADGTLRRPEDVRSALGLPLVGTVPRLS